MEEQKDKQETAYFERVNADLSKGLRRCHLLVDDCRAKLASNSNGPDAANDAEAEPESRLDEA